MTRSSKPRKHLTQEDADIWSRITRTARPLPESEKNFASLFSDETLSDLSKLTTSAPGSLSKLRDSAAPVYQPGVQLKPISTSSQIDLKTTRKISKGKIVIDGRLDLHGYTQQDAHRLLHDYVENAYYTRKRIILVITGKGNMGRGVLRENVPKWLAEPAFRRLISAFGESHSSHGGVGALYVRIRRKP